MQQLVEQNAISYRVAKLVFDTLWDKGGSPESVIAEQQLSSVQDADQFRSLVQKAIANNPKQVRKYLDGNKRLIGFFIGEIMKATKGRADPKLANRIVVEELDRLSE